MSQPQAALRDPWLPWLLLPLAATLLGLIEAGQVQYDRALRGEPITWTHALVHGLPRWYAWAVVTPLVLYIARRVERARLGWGGALAVHLCASVPITLLQVALFSVASNAYHADVDPLAHLRFAFLKYAGLTFWSGLVIYALLVAGWGAWSVYGRYRDRERVAAQLELHASELKAQLAEARLHQLQSQLQPHTLFNTLHALSGLVLKGDTTRAVRMVARLSDLLRRSLRIAESTEITLREELLLLEDYLSIQRLRFGDQLRTEVCADDAAREAFVPTLALQPLVENAIRHGIEADPDAGEVIVRAARHGDRLEVTIWNSGPGLGGSRPGGGVGLQNTRARLETLYGATAGLHLREVGGGVEVRVVLPFRAAGAEDGAPPHRPVGAAPVEVRGS